MTALAAPPHRLQRRTLVVDVQHGLCNRLRALASAVVIARRCDRRLVVVWRTDAHCQARADDLFRLPWPVIETDAADLLREAAVRVWNYMEIEPGARFNEPVQPEDLAGPGDVYLRSAYRMTGPLTDHDREAAVLRRLRPTEPVLELLRQVPRPFDVALHVRMATGPAFDHLAHESPANWPEERHRELTEWRQKSDVRQFVAALDRLVAEGRAARIFVAADLAATYAVLTERYGERLRFLARDLYDRSARQMQYALADLMLLTAAPLFLGSNWSSFSDVAQSLAPAGRAMLTAGVDF